MVCFLGGEQASDGEAVPECFRGEPCGLQQIAERATTVVARESHDGLVWT